MIVSNRYKFIFLKTNKTAGTSVEIALSEFCGPTDIITPITPEDEEIRSKLGNRGPQNFLAPPWDYNPGDLASFLISGKKKLRFYNHIPARVARARLGRQLWDDYFKFCIERNPWDRVVSLYYWKNQLTPRISFNEFVNSQAPLILKRRGFELYTIDGHTAVDKICRFENLVLELESIRKHVGIPEKLVLQHAKSRFRSENHDYREIYSEAEKRRVADIFAEEIRLFGYEF